MRIAAPAPTWVAAPAGAIGSAPDAAAAQRTRWRAAAKAGSRGRRAGGRARGPARSTGENEHPSLPGVPRETVRAPSQRARRKRMSRPLATRRGRTATATAAPRPANATTPIAARTAVDVSEVAAAVGASGIRAAVSTRPSMKSERADRATPARPPLARRTTAMRTTSSKRPRRAAPVTDAAPHEAASVSGDWALLGGEEAVPAVRLEREREEKEQACCGHEPHVGAPRTGSRSSEVTGSEHGHGDRERPTARFSASFHGGTAHVDQPSHRVSHRLYRRDEPRLDRAYPDIPHGGEDSALARVPFEGL